MPLQADAFYIIASRQKIEYSVMELSLLLGRVHDVSFYNSGNNL